MKPRAHTTIPCVCRPSLALFGAPEHTTQLSANQTLLKTLYAFEAIKTINISPFASNGMESID